MVSTLGYCEVGDCEGSFGAVSEAWSLQVPDVSTRPNGWSKRHCLIFLSRGSSNREMGHSWVWDNGDVFRRGSSIGKMCCHRGVESCPSLEDLEVESGQG